jgi:enoyl-CoA hydratase
VELTKRGLWAGLETPSLAAAVELENRLQVLSSLTEDQAEASRAWMEKRAPQYQGR